MAVIVKNASVRKCYFGPKIPTIGLVGYWNAASRLSYPRVGSTWFDLVQQNKNNGSMVNMSATNFTDDGHGALVFDGTNEIVEIPHDPSLDFGSSSFTVSLWINVTDENSSASAGSYVIGKRGRGVLGSYAGWQIRIRNVSGTTWQIVYSGIDDGTSSQTNGTVAVNTMETKLGESGEYKWYMLTMIYDAAEGILRFVINDTSDVGITFLPSSFGSVSNTIPIEIMGTRYVNHSLGAPETIFDLATATLANVALYDRALTVQEITDKFMATKDLYNLGELNP